MPAPLAEDQYKLVQDYAAQIKAGQYSNVAAWRYGYALSLEAAGRYDQARELLTEAEADPADAPRFADLAYSRKRLILRISLVSELTVLAAQLDRIEKKLDAR